jgi:hypothetical protein
LDANGTDDANFPTFPALANRAGTTSGLKNDYGRVADGEVYFSFSGGLKMSFPIPMLGSTQDLYTLDQLNTKLTNPAQTKTPGYTYLIDPDRIEKVKTFIPETYASKFVDSQPSFVIDGKKVPFTTKAERPQVVDENYSNKGMYQYPGNGLMSLNKVTTSVNNYPNGNTKVSDLKDSTQFNASEVTTGEGSIQVQNQDEAGMQEISLLDFAKASPPVDNIASGEISWAIDSDLVSFYVLQGTAMQLALKIMLSNGPEYWAENVEIQNFVQLPDASLIDNAIYFEGVDIPEKYGVTVGDFCTVTGASNGANNFVDRAVVGIIETDTGYYIQVDGAALVVETDSAAVIKFKSRFATLPIGLGMSPDEVDVTEHLRIEQLFLSSFEYKFYLKESIDNAQDWLEQEVYKPASAYSLPRRARSSVGFLSQPIPSEDSVTITSKDVVKPQNLTIRRTTAKAFFNHIVYKFEQDSLEDKFLRGRINRSQTSIDRIKVGKNGRSYQARRSRVF